MGLGALKGMKGPEGPYKPLKGFIRPSRALEGPHHSLESIRAGVEDSFISLGLP